jgi:membrane protein required for colicin V production
MIYDLVMIAVLLVTIALGAYRGLAWQLASLASIVVGYSAALRFAGDVAPLIDLEAPWNWVAAMVAVFAAGSLAVWLLFRMVSGFIDRMRLKEFDKQMGGLVGAAKGVLLCLAITFFAVTVNEKSRKQVLESKSGWYMALLIDRADPLLPENLHAIVGPYLHQLEKELDTRGGPERPAEDYHGPSGLPASIPSANPTSRLTVPPAEILPEYVIEPPDILLDGPPLLPSERHRIEPFDLLQIIADGAPDQFPIANNFPVEPGGTVNLGSPYGRVNVSGLNIEEATAAIDGHLRSHLIDPKLSISLTPDNRDWYYVILEGAGLGDTVNRFPSTGNETVQDALSQIKGLDPTSKRIWIKRPGRNSEGGPEAQFLPVDIQTKFPLLPGDRVFVSEDKNVSRGAIDTRPTRISGAALRGEVRK